MTERNVHRLVTYKSSITVHRAAHSESLWINESCDCSSTGSTVKLGRGASVGGVILNCAFSTDQTSSSRQSRLQDKKDM